MISGATLGQVHGVHRPIGAWFVMWKGGGILECEGFTLKKWT